MMGKDCERIVTGINNVKDEIAKQIKLLSDVPILGTPLSRLAYVYEGPIRNAMNKMDSDISKMNELNDGLYTSSESFNNSYGSPWKELNLLQKSVKDIKDRADIYKDILTLEEKLSLLHLMHISLSRSVDAKWAMIYYHDYIQRGYDNKFNGNIPSITFASGSDKETTGNLNQQFDENVHIPEKNIDPY